MTQPHPLTLLDRVWDAHVVAQQPQRPALLYIDLHLIHEVTSPQAFAMLKARGLKVRRPDRTLATMDHVFPTTSRAFSILGDSERQLYDALVRGCEAHGIELLRLGEDDNGVVHIIGPELGRSQPGMTIVCGDSHTSTHGAFGALAFGIGTSEVGHVLATQCLLQHRPKSFRVRVDGTLPEGVSAKDVILTIIARLGIGGATGHVFEYQGSAIDALDMDGRMTVCNMSIEAGARAGMIAPDDTTFSYLYGRPGAPQGADWEGAVTRWRSLRSDDDAVFDKTLTLDAASLEPMITFGTNPGMGAGLGEPVPSPASAPTPEARAALTKALDYMAVEPGKPLLGKPIDVVFVGSCTNGRLSDLRAAANVLADRKVNPRVRMLVVPGSQRVKREAEAEGLHRVFEAAGAQWREPGCSMCIAMNGDSVPRGAYAVSTSNRNFEGRQGPGSRTFLASPATAAASAVAGVVTDAARLAAGMWQVS